jgi:hypothetical protein
MSDVLLLALAALAWTGLGVAAFFIDEYVLRRKMAYEPVQPDRSIFFCVCCYLGGVALLMAAHNWARWRGGR